MEATKTDPVPMQRLRNEEDIESDMMGESPISPPPSSSPRCSRKAKGLAMGSLGVLLLAAVMIGVAQGAKKDHVSEQLHPPVEGKSPLKAGSRQLPAKPCLAVQVETPSIVCMPDGAFSTRQCDDNFCWCVDVEGKEKLITRGPKHEVTCADAGECPSVNCNTYCEEGFLSRRNGCPFCSCYDSALSTCENWAEADRLACGGMLGCALTRCLPGGAFSPTQCHGGVCWCVNGAGEEVLGTRGPAATTTCDLPATGCLAAVRAQSEACGGRLGCALSRCAPDGSYMPVQCHEAQCWCVDSAGQEVAGSRLSGAPLTALACTALTSPTGALPATPPATLQATPPAAAGAAGAAGATPPSGTSPIATPRELEGSACWSLLRAQEVACGGLLGCSLSRCLPDGSFAPMQCTGSLCWCVDAQGQELLGTRNAAGLATCPVSQCPLLRSAQLEACQGGQAEQACWVAECDQDGGFANKQCAGNGCWCVLRDGQEMEGTRAWGEAKDSVSCHTPYLLGGEGPCPPAQRQLFQQCQGRMGCPKVQCMRDGSFWGLQHVGSQAVCVSSLDGSSLPARSASSSSTTTPVSGTTAGVALASLYADEPSSFLTLSDVCPTLGAGSRCEVRRRSEQTACGGLIGCHSVDCLPDGSFAPQQCSASTGLCWCVDAGGVEVTGSRATSHSQELNCPLLLQRAGCQQPLKTGPCRGYMRRFGWDGSKCVDFVYGGCQANANNFASRDLCQQTCGSVEALVPCLESQTLCDLALQAQGVNCVVGACVTRSSVPFVPAATPVCADGKRPCTEELQASGMNCALGSCV